MKKIFLSKENDFNKKSKSNEIYKYVPLVYDFDKITESLYSTLIVAYIFKILNYYMHGETTQAYRKSIGNSNEEPIELH